MFLLTASDNAKYVKLNISSIGIAKVKADSAT